MKQKIINIVRFLDWELIIWLGGLCYLALLNPDSSGHFSLCPFKNLGFHFCPGCGLGQSISLFFHGRFEESLRTHPLGILAFIVLFSRIIKLSLINLKRFRSNYGRTRTI